MAPRGRPTRLNPTTTPPPVTDPTTTTSVTSAQLQAMIDEGVTAVLAARATTRNGDDSHTSGTGVRRNEHAVRDKGTWQEAIEMATKLMDRRINTLAERQTENKRKFEDAPRNNQNQQPNKRQNTGRAYAAGNGDKKPYEGTKLEEGLAPVEEQEFRELDRSFVSTQFSTLINIAPTTLDHGYNVELADEMGTYDVIIGMDWLTKYQAVIVCAKKIVPPEVSAARMSRLFGTYYRKGDGGQVEEEATA
ncbi:hypothetical protein Tco_1054049 [Tanacetum coccineum]|uniref:Reverse transcriptase domain-containing protein n=1 Tax=Tanacetum coccineum TaxID=301880 RepID=A0ABQ5GXI8_9ASTR